MLEVWTAHAPETAAPGKSRKECGNRIKLQAKRRKKRRPGGSAKSRQMDRGEPIRNWLDLKREKRLATACVLRWKIKKCRWKQKLTKKLSGGQKNCLGIYKFVWKPCICTMLHRKPHFTRSLIKISGGQKNCLGFFKFVWERWILTMLDTKMNFRELTY